MLSQIRYCYEADLLCNPLVKTFLVGYGLLEFVGVIMRPIMRPLFKTPGRSAIDAVASFVGSYSLGLVITNRVFREGKYTNREASVIATGFSTVSATFMIIVARTLGLMEMWNLYFWSTLVITFIVTAITVRIWPLSKKSLQELAGMYASLLHVSRLIAIKATLPLIIAVIR